MQQAIDWMIAHPETWPLFWAVITAVFNFTFKWRSEEEYAGMNRYLRGVLRFTTSLGVDPVKATKLAKELAAKKGVGS